ncbi:hypothetical protein GN956_G7194 [Arapaima gigas]
MAVEGVSRAPPAVSDLPAAAAPPSPFPAPPPPSATYLRAGRLVSRAGKEAPHAVGQSSRDIVERSHAELHCASLQPREAPRSSRLLDA